MFVSVDAELLTRRTEFREWKPNHWIKKQLNTQRAKSWTVNNARLDFKWKIMNNCDAVNAQAITPRITRIKMNIIACAKFLKANDSSETSKWFFFSYIFFFWFAFHAISEIENYFYHLCWVLSSNSCHYLFICAQISNLTEKIE